ncbi:MAG: hypothetical protein JSS91_03735 [Bacteroidetes bacterium]|nr:hypothetical protein [Bacteroidota bacterium]
MKLIKYFLIALLMTSSAFAQNVKITDFDLPVSTAKTFVLNGFYNWAQTTPDDTATAKSLSSSWSLNGKYTQFYSSPSYAWNLSLNGALSQSSRGDTTRYEYDLASDVSKYFSDSHGFFGNAELRSNFLRKREFGKDNRPTIEIFGGVGYGRQVNATALAKAIRIDEDLKKGGITSKFMPKSTMLAIAQIIDREAEYKDKYKALYESKIIEDISAEVLNSGVSKYNSMTSLGFMRIRDVLYGVNQFINPRAYGGDVRLGVAYQLLTRNEAIKSPSPTLDIRGRYAYPIGIQHQISAFLNARTPIDSNFVKLFTGNAGINYSYNLTNRISFNAGYTATINQIFRNVGGVAVGSDKSSVDHSLTAGFNFYIENYITFNLTGGYSKIFQTEDRFFTNASVGFIIF